MQGKQNSLVPVAKLIADLPGLGLAIGPSQHSFTVADQVNQLVRASEADPDLGFMARTIALCSLPRTNPGNRLQYKRVNGPFTLIMTATGNYKLPFGNLPRLILAWVSTEAVRTQSPVLSLGKSLSDFMRALGVYDSSGRTQTRLRNQMKRLFGCTVTMIYEDENVDATVNAVIADSTVFWWNKPDQRTLWDSKIELGEKFFNEIIQHPVPLNMNTLTALKRSRWASISTCGWSTGPSRSALRCASPGGRCTASSERTLTRPATSAPFNAFRYKVLRELKKIKLAWPGLNYSTARGVLILHPSTPAIAPIEQAQLTS